MALAVAASGAGCSPDSRYRVLALLFEDVPPPGAEAHVVPVVRSPRHPRPPTPTPTVPPVEVAPAPATLHTWDDVVRLLPKDQVGNPDWVAALREHLIAPRPGVAPEAAEQEVLALDVEIAPSSDPAFAVTFSHERHGEWLACANCHPEPFATEAGRTPMTAADAHGERYCGACHGTVAFDIAAGCPLCHLRNLPKDSRGRVEWSRALADGLITPRAGTMARAADQPVLDLDVELGSTAQPAARSIFSHRTHTQWLACASCHPRPFPAEGGWTAPEPAALHSRRYCGACHGSVEFGITTACERCHPSLEKTKQHQAVLDLDVEVTPKSGPSSQFSHKVHRFVECPSCHTNLFEQTAGATKITMADLQGGRYCAACHGDVATDLIAQCQRCHAALEHSE